MSQIKRIGRAPVSASKQRRGYLMLLTPVELRTLDNLSITKMSCLRSVFIVCVMSLARIYKASN